MRHTSRRGRVARRELKQSQRETAQSRRETAAVSKDRDDLIGQRDTARAYTASALGNGAPPGNSESSAGLDPSHDDERGDRPRLFGRRPPRQPATAPADARTGQPAPDVPAGAPAPAE
jgi:hypothetical protein